MSRLLLLNKPYLVLSQFTDKEGRNTLADFIDEDGVYPAGRLDYDSEGLLLLTDDGRLQHRIASPEMKQPKTYQVQVEGEITEEALQQLRRGVELKDGMTLPAKARAIEDPGFAPRNPPVRERKTIPTSWVELIITEGRNRQVRRMTAAVGFPTLRLVRTAIGSWNLEGLAPGEYKALQINLPAEGVKKANRPHIKGQSARNGRRTASGNRSSSSRNASAKKSDSGQKKAASGNTVRKKTGKPGRSQTNRATDSKTSHQAPQHHRATNRRTKEKIRKHYDHAN